MTTQKTRFEYYLSKYFTVSFNYCMNNILINKFCFHYGTRYLYCQDFTKEKRFIELYGIPKTLIYLFPTFKLKTKFVWLSKVYEFSMCDRYI